MAPREGFEPPRPMDSGFRIHRNTGLCDLGSAPATYESNIRLTRCVRGVRIQVEHDNRSLSLESDVPISISQILDRLSIPASTVLAVHGDTIVPHTSIIESDISLELIIVSSGG